MSFTMYSMAMDTFVPLLGTLSTLLDKGAEHMKAKGLKPDALAEARLAPDMFPLTRQVQIACDQAKSVAARLTGQEPPRFEDNEQTLDELKTRIRRTLDYVGERAFERIPGRRDSSGGLPAHGGLRARHGRRAVPARLGAAELLFPRRHGLRHPAQPGRPDRQAGLPGTRRYAIRKKAG